MQNIDMDLFPNMGSTEDMLKEARMQGYDYARKRIRKYLLDKAKKASNSACSYYKDVECIIKTAEYIGIILADYDGRMLEKEDYDYVQKPQK